MKTKLIFLLFIFFVSLSFGQKAEKKAQKFTEEITEVLSLSEEQSEVVYQIQLERFSTAQLVRKEFADDEETMKAKLKENGNNTYNRMKNLIGEEKLKEWKQYQQNKIKN